MAPIEQPTDKPTTLSELFTRYLQRQVHARGHGLGFAESGGEVVPHEAVPVQPVDPQLAWNDALAVTAHFPGGPPVSSWSVPSDWPALVAAQEPAVALAFCLGNFPQLVRDFHPLLNGDLAAIRLAPGRPTPDLSLQEWAARNRGYPQVLLAAGVLRLARHFDQAEKLLRPPAPAEWHLLHANETAALAWHVGRADEALALWNGQPDSVPVLLNRGMAALFQGFFADARTNLAKAVEALPDSSAWHHLGHLYLALADARQ
jgi:hypothetical protein